MRQKELLSIYQGFLLIGVCLMACESPSPANKSTPPNIIFIMADDLGYGDLGSYGQKIIQTPHLDQMAKEGMRFTHCYAGSPVCAPSRSCLMTGLHTGHTTVRGNFGKTGVMGLGGKPGRVPLKEEDQTVAELLKTAGYRTGMAGKWGLGEPATTGHPNLQGFDEFYGFLNQRRAHNYYPEYIWHNQDKVLLEGNSEGKEETYVHDLFTDFALDFVQRHQDTSFFLYLPYTVPHDLYQIPDTDPYAQENWTPDEKVHAAMVTRLDRDIGRLFARLDSLDMADNSIVFFCSDNGAAQRWEGRFDSSGPLRGRKRDVYEGGIRTPLIVRYPEKVAAGSISNFPCYFPDMLPTFMEIAGMPSPEGLDGISMWPVLQGQKREVLDRYLYWEFHERGFQQAVRWKNWKAVKASSDTPLELYDLSIDEAERTNLATDHPEIIAQIETYLQSARTPSVDWPGQ